MRLAICIFACLVNQTYLYQAVTLYESWVQTALRHGAVVRFFVGQVPRDNLNIPQGLIDLCVELPQFGDGYESSTGKHWQGLRYLYENYPSEFYYTCGTDTFLNYHNAIELLLGYEPLLPLYIGGHGCKRDIFDHVYRFHSGGPGYFYSHTAMKCIVDHWDEYVVNLFYTTKHDMLKYCDVQAGYIAEKLGLHFEHVEGKFWHCNLNGHPCHPGQVCKDTLVACHLMSNHDILEYHKYLESGTGMIRPLLYMPM